MSLNFRDLEYFLTLAEVGHMGRAAAVHGVSQPALSKSLKRLEQQIGLQLYHRSSGKLVMSKEGAAFLAHAKRLGASYNDAMNHAASLQKGVAGVLHVGATGATMERIVTPALQWLTSRRPALRIRLTVGMSDELFERLRQGKLDCAVAPLYGEALEGFDHEIIFQDEMCIVARRNHPVTRKARVRLADALIHPWIFPNTDSSAYRMMQTYLDLHSLPLPNVAMEVPLINPGILGIVATTNLISLAPRSLLKRINGNGLVVLPIKLPFRRQVSLITRNDANWTPLMDAFHEAVTGSERKTGDR